VGLVTRGVIHGGRFQGIPASHRTMITDLGAERKFTRLNLLSLISGLSGPCAEQVPVVTGPVSMRIISHRNAIDIDRGKTIDTDHGMTDHGMTIDTDHGMTIDIGDGKTFDLDRGEVADYEDLLRGCPQAGAYQ
jgi:hypothetical protein